MHRINLVRSGQQQPRRPQRVIQIMTPGLQFGSQSPVQDQRALRLQKPLKHRCHWSLIQSILNHATPY